MIDSHCHIGFDELKDNVADLVARATQNGVSEMLTVACDKSQASDLYSVLDSFQNVWGAFGIHPENADKRLSDTDLSEIILGHKKILAVGETGLDYAVSDVDKGTQIQNFIQHLELAKKLNMPIIIHTRSADEDTISILKEQGADGRLKGVLHCFTGTPKLAQTAIDIGFFISASGIITFKKAQDLRDIFSEVPFDNLLVETDCPYLAPVPMRGKMNEPSFLPYTLQVLADIKDVPVAQMEKITDNNFNRLFKGVK